MTLSSKHLYRCLLENEILSHFEKLASLYQVVNIATKYKRRLVLFTYMRSTRLCWASGECPYSHQEIVHSFLKLGMANDTISEWLIGKLLWHERR